jgi:4-diphosphocytidyl-2-C-methyl-D-erythritol kinase
VTRAPATAKINLALVVGPRRPDGKHEVTTVLQRVALSDRIALEEASELRVDGFGEDTLVREALTRLAAAAGAPARWRARIEKRIPVAAGLGGGSSDAATALHLANRTLAEPVPPDQLEELARGLGADVPFFLRSGPQLGRDEGATLSPLELPQDYFVLLVLPHDTEKRSTADVYAAFAAREGHDGYEERRDGLLARLQDVRRPRDLATLPLNDLASSPIADRLRSLGAFRADVTGAGPAVYGLFLHPQPAVAAQRQLRTLGRTWLTPPAWYG